MATNVPKPTFGPRGFIVPDESAILAGVQEDIDAAFGGGLNPSLETPQGQLASSTAAVVAQANETFLLYTNLVDPALSSGKMQDAIARIYFIERISSEPTIIYVQCFGLEGVPIPAGSLLRDTSGNTYASTDDGVIDSVGHTTIAFANQVPGPTAVPGENDVSIYQAIPGWDSVLVLSGVLGNDTEGPRAFEERRAATVAKNSFGAIGSIIGEVSEVPNVLDYFGYDNGGATPISIVGVSVAAHSIYIAVSGGEDVAVAQAILSKKAPGCGYTGNTTVTAFDENPLYSAPVPYQVTFQRPASLPILFSVLMASGPLVPADAAAQITAAIISAFAGADGGPRARIASKIYASRFYAPIASLGAWAQIIDIFVGSKNTPTAGFTAAAAGTVLTVSAVASGALAAGQSVYAASGGLDPATTIVAQLSGPAGGTGTYSISPSQTVSSRAMTTAAANGNTVQVNADQNPTITASNIAVSVS